MSAAHAALLGLGIFLASCVPFLPTGEAVSAASALASDSWPSVAAVFAVVLVASLSGDTVMFAAAGWLVRHRPGRGGGLSARVRSSVLLRAGAKINDHAVTSMVSGRLMPGGRAPVIITLGIGGYPLRRFVAADALACAVWAGVYVSLGAVGGQLTDHPVLATAVAVGCAICLSLLTQAVRTLLGRGRWAARRHTGAVGTGEALAEEVFEPEPEGGQSHGDHQAQPPVHR